MTRKLPREVRVSDVIDAAMEVFLEHGYEGASMEAIARRAGLTKGGLYHHFPGKDEILIAANARFMEPVRRLMEEARANPSAAEGLRGFIRSYLDWWRTHARDLSFVMLTLYKVMRSPESWPFMREYTAEMIGFYQELLERAIAAGELSHCDPGARALAMLGALDGLVGYVAMDPELAEHAAERLSAALLG
jgi:AcrR family transcriptional regulator